MPDENLTKSILAMQRYERVQARMLDDMRKQLAAEEAQVDALRLMLGPAGDAESGDRSSPPLARLILRSLNPLRPCGWRRACSRFAWVTWLVPSVILLADWLGRALS
jgi:hypothetical protein